MEISKPPLGSRNDGTGEKNGDGGLIGCYYWSCCGITMRRFVRIIFLLSSVIIYLIVGGSLFKQIENQEIQVYNEKAAIQERYLNEMLGNFTESINDRAPTVSVNEVKQFIETYRQASQVAKAKPQWAHTDGIYYCMTIITTIGYGDITCETKNGQILTIIYGVFGIALSGLLITEMARALKRIAQKILQRAPCAPDENQSNKWIGRLFNISLAISGTLIIYSLFMLLPAYWLTEQTGWSLVESHYFLFVSFGTIGFGDYTLKEFSSNMGILYMVIMYMGLAALAAIVGLISERINIASYTFETKLNDQEPPPTPMTPTVHTDTENDW